MESVCSRVCLIVLVCVVVAVVLSVVPVFSGEGVDYWSEKLEGGVVFVKVSSGGGLVGVSLVNPSRVVVFSSSGGVLWSYSFKDGDPSGIDFSPDDSVLAVLVGWKVGNNDYFKVVGLDARSGEKLWESQGFKYTGWDLRFTPDGSLLIVTCYDGNAVFALDPSSGSVVWSRVLSGVDYTVDWRFMVIDYMLVVSRLNHIVASCTLLT